MTEPRAPAARRLAVKLGLSAVAMFGFGFLLVPIYDAVCRITGIGGRTSDVAAVAVAGEIDADRSVVVEFVAIRNEQATWEFRPATVSMEVHPGQLYDTTFFARNLTTSRLVGQAIPRVAPGIAAKYFKKTECFCFRPQPFDGGEGRDLGLQFMVDPDLPQHIDRLTLSYTLFQSPAGAEAAPPAAAS
jgi:cytochrome c oxidase assembly protein subunit 11